MPRQPALVILVAATVSLALTGCGSSPVTSAPAGVDGLLIPTPTPTPSDFVDRVDNPWFPLRPGTVRTYVVTGTGDPQRETVTVTGRTRVIQGVTTTVVHDRVVGAAGQVAEDSYDWYAQDTAGSWQAGVDGAEAGVLMLASPRIGDGYVQAHAPGVAEDRAQILSLTEQRVVRSQTYGGLLLTEDTSPLAPGLVERRYYAQGLGLLYEETVTGGYRQVELTGVTQR